MNKVALVIIYNHKYNKNIEILERIYKDRFSNIYHLVPFYNGDKPNVIPVYENSWYFQGYISQGFKSYFKEEYTHYFFVADDLILNPKINENNYAEHLKLNSNTCFIPYLFNLNDDIQRITEIYDRAEKWWPRIVNKAFHWTIKVRRIEAENELPIYEEALQKFLHFGLTIKPLRFDKIWGKPYSIIDFIERIFSDRFYLLRYIKNKIWKTSYPLSYPLVGSYSDIFVVSKDTIKEFCHYCGVFSATNLFVEIALPTSLVLSAKEIVSEKDLKLQGKALWWETKGQELDKYDYSLKQLLDQFPINYLYLHPIKLSKWKMDLCQK